MEMTPDMIRAALTVQPTRVGNSIFIPLPPELWRRCDGCRCDVCKADNTGGYWDTLAVSAKAPAHDWTWTVHHPALHSQRVRAAYAYSVEGYTDAAR